MKKELIRKPKEIDTKLWVITEWYWKGLKISMLWDDKYDTVFIKANKNFEFEGKELQHNVSMKITKQSLCYLPWSIFRIYLEDMTRKIINSLNIREDN